jgi:hypothetical protein
MIQKNAPDRTQIVLPGAALDGFSRTLHFSPPELGYEAVDVSVRLHLKALSCQEEYLVETEG